MGQQIGLGSLVGLVVGLLCWRGNQRLQVVSTFPDLITFVVLAVLLAAAIRLVVLRGQRHGRSATFRAAVTVATAAGVVFGSAVIALQLLRFSNPAPALLAFGFLTAFCSALLCGLAVALFRPGTPRERAA